MHYYQFNIADYRKDTMHLTPIEHYIYRTLIDWYYLDEKPIPKITQVVTRRLCLGSELENNVQNVLQDFFFECGDGWHHKRIDDDICEYHAQCDKNKENGKLGGRPKTQTKPKITQVVSENNQTLTQNNPTVTLTTNHKPLTTNYKPLKPKPSVHDGDEFDRFWDAYPKKSGKIAAKKAWIKNKPPIDDVLVALLWQSKSDQWLTDDGRYIPNPLTYINQGRWHDEPQAIVKKQKSYNDSISDTMRQIFSPLGGNNGTRNSIIDIATQQTNCSGATDFPELGNGIWKEAG